MKFSKRSFLVMSKVSLCCKNGRILLTPTITINQLRQLQPIMTTILILQMLLTLPVFITQVLMTISFSATFT